MNYGVNKRDHVLWYKDRQVVYNQGCPQDFQLKGGKYDLAYPVMGRLGCHIIR